MILTIKSQDLQQKKWYTIDSEAKGDYLPNNEIKFLASSLESSLYLWLFWCIYFSYRNITITDGNANTKVAFKNCAPFEKCITEINETFADDAQHINIAIPMYKLIEYRIIILIHLVFYGNLKKTK